MDRISWWIYFGVSIWSLLLIIGVLLFVLDVATCVEGDRDCEAPLALGLTLNATLFGWLAIILIATIIPLCMALA